MKRLVSLAVAGIAIAASAAQEKLAEAVFTDRMDLITQATKIGEMVGQPMVGMLAVNGLTSNPLAEAFGAMREGACVSAVVYGDPDAFKPDEPEYFFEALKFAVAYPASKSKASVLAADEDAVETNGVVKIDDMFAAFSEDGKWVSFGNDAEFAKGYLAESASRKPCNGEAASVRLTTAALKLIARAAEDAAGELKKEMAGKANAQTAVQQMENFANVLKQVKGGGFGFKASDKGLDIRFCAAPVEGTELAKVGLKSISKSKPLSFAGRDALVACAYAEDSGNGSDMKNFDRLVEFLTKKGFKLDFVKTDIQGPVVRQTLDLQKLVEYAKTEGLEACQKISDPESFLEELQLAVAAPKFEAKNPELFASLAIKGLELPSTASARFEKTLPEMAGRPLVGAAVISMYGTIRLVADEVMKMFPDNPQLSTIKGLLATLPPVGDDCIAAASWRKDANLAVLCRVTPGEMKAISSLFMAGFTVVQSQMGGMTCDELDEDDEDEDDSDGE